MRAINGVINIATFSFGMAVTVLGLAVLVDEETSIMLGIIVTSWGFHLLYIWAMDRSSKVDQ
jgi:hypothetical protein